MEKLMRAKRNQPFKHELIKKTFLVGWVIMLGLMVAACSSGKKQVREEVKANTAVIIEAFNEGDMPQINKCIFGTPMDEQNGSGEESLLQNLFLRTTIEVSKITDDHIEYEVSVPDMSQFFMQEIPESTDLTDANFRKLFFDYATKAEIITKQVNVPYTVDGESITVDYQTAEFIDAITGGLLQGYSDIYRQIVNEYRDKIEEG